MRDMFLPEYDTITVLNADGWVGNYVLSIHKWVRHAYARVWYNRTVSFSRHAHRPTFKLMSLTFVSHRIQPSMPEHWLYMYGLNNDFLSRVGRFVNDFDEHEEASQTFWRIFSWVTEVVICEQSYFIQHRLRHAMMYVFSDRHTPGRSCF